MAQFLRPIADISNPQTWAVEPLWDKINDEEPDVFFSTFVSKSPAVVGDQFEVKLTRGITPDDKTNHTIRYIIAQSFSSPGRGTVLVELYQNSTLIASTPESGIDLFSIGIHEYTLTEIEASTITDYSDLRLRFTFPTIFPVVDVAISWAEMEVPFTPPVRTTIDSIIHPRNADSVIFKDEQITSTLNV